MGHGKETPRQKMIGMMYLVLTALLALNVSAEVLNAFLLIDNSLTKTSENFQVKNDEVYTKFQKAFSENASVKPFKDKADEVAAKSNDLFEIIHGYKLEIVQTADGPEGDPKNIQNKADNNIPGQLMVLEGRGEKLKEEIIAHREFLLSLIEDTARSSLVYNSVKNTLNTNDITGNTGEKVSWVAANFDHLPLAGVITLMSKMQNDVRTAEAEIIAYLFGQIDAGSFKFNKLEAIVNASTNYVLKGNEYKAEVFIAASDSTVEPEIELAGGTKLKIVDGKGQYVGNTSSVGFKTWTGVIKMKSPATGEILEFPFKSEYQVAEAGLVVSPTKMNVFYIGVKNPVDVSVPGVPADKVTARISSGSIVKSGSGYVVTVKKPGKVFVSASADFSGNVKQMGKKEFRVKRVPDPIAKIGSDPKNSQGGVMPKNLLLAQAGIKADLENFAFDLKYRVTGFTVSATIKGYEEEASSTNALFTSKQKALIKKVATGRKIYIENIRAKGPDGSTRKLGSIVLKLR